MTLVKTFEERKSVDKYVIQGFKQRRQRVVPLPQVPLPQTSVDFVDLSQRETSSASDESEASDVLTRLHRNPWS